MDESDLVYSFLDAHNDAGAYWGKPGSRVGDRYDDWADAACHRYLRLDFRAHLSLRRPDVWTKTRPGPTGETGTDEVKVKG